MSGKSFFLTERRVRKRNLLDLIRNSGEQGVSLKKVKSVFSLKTGLSFRKIEEYLRELEEGGLIEISEDTVKTVE